MSRIRMRAGRWAGMSLFAACAVAQGQPGADAQEGERSVVRLEEIVVTGTHIRGVDAPAPTIVIDRNEIQQAGHSTIQAVLDSLPQQFSDLAPGGRYATEGGSNLSISNNDRASSANLRGLGAESTLTLIDGMRQAGSVDGRVVDLSNVPLSMIERVEVVTGGRSAIYGSDAVGGVVNLIPRRDVERAESEVYFGSADAGGERLSVSQLVGDRAERGGYVVGYEYSRDWAFDLADAGLLSSEPAPLGVQQLGLQIQAPTQKHSGFFSGHYSPNDRLELHGLAMYTYERFQSTERQYWEGASNESLGWMFHPTRQFGASAGALLSLTRAWGLSVRASTSTADVRNRDSTYTDDGFEPYSSVLLTRNKANTASLSAVVNGGIDLPSGTSQVALGAEVRNEQFRGNQILDGASFSEHDRDRDVASAFVELNLPLLGSGDLVARDVLALSLAGRYDDYSDFGHTFNPQYRLAWRPAPGVRLHGGYSKSFRAPALVELSDRTFAQLRSLDDPRSSTGRSPALIVRLDNPNLGPEQAENWDFTLEIEPEAISGLSVSLSYFEVNYRDRIAVPAASSSDQLMALVNEDRYGHLIDRDPDPEAVQALVQHARTSVGFRNHTGVPFDPETQRIWEVFPDLVVFDDRNNNIAEDRVRGMDLLLKHGRDTMGGHISYGLNATYTLEHTRRTTRNSAPAALLNQVGKPVDLRVRASVGWTRSTLGVYAYLNYVDGYDNPYSEPPGRIDSWTTADLTVQFDGTDLSRSSFLSGYRLALSVQNVLDEDPPEYSNSLFGVRYDSTNANPFGRYLSLRVAKTW